MNDILGTELNIGDSVLYTNGGGSGFNLFLGIIIAFRPDYTIEVTSSEGRGSISRFSEDLVSVEPIKLQNPENFL